MCDEAAAKQLVADESLHDHGTRLSNEEMDSLASQIDDIDSLTDLLSNAGLDGLEQIQVGYSMSEAQDSLVSLNQKLKDAERQYAESQHRALAAGRPFVFSGMTE